MSVSGFSSELILIPIGAGVEPARGTSGSRGADGFDWLIHLRRAERFCLPSCLPRFRASPGIPIGTLVCLEVSGSQSPFPLDDY